VVIAIYTLASSVSSRVVFASGETLSDLGLPSSLEEAKVLSGLLSMYVENPEHNSILVQLFLLFVLIFLAKQTFCLPGSAMLNIIAGAVLPQLWSFPLVVILTAVGASCCYWLSALLGVALLSSVMKPETIHRLKARITDSTEKGTLFFFLLSFRVLPFGPQFLLNLVSPVAGVPFGHFFLATLLGLSPYCYITTGIGELFAEAARQSALGETASSISIFSGPTMIKLSLLALAVLIPTLFGQFYKPKKSANVE